VNHSESGPGSGPAPAPDSAPRRKSLAAPIALGLAVALLAGVAVKRMVGGAGRADAEARGDDDPYRPRNGMLADFGEVADFTLIDTDGKSFGRKELLGKIWVADFVFTSCSGPCIPMTQGLRTAVQDLRGEPDVEFVTITVDPETDTPDVLRNFATARGGLSPRWHWLSGDKTVIFKLLQESFHGPVGDKLPDGQVPHSTRYFVVDRKGHLRMMHDTQTDPDKEGGPARGVVETVRALLKQQPPDAGK
jgi:protein SCO1/2